MISDNPQGPGSPVKAFEEDSSFVYAAGEVSLAELKLSPKESQESLSRLIRRIIILKPSVVVVDDEVVAPDSNSPAEWCLQSRNVPKVSGNKGELREEAGDLSWETIFPGPNITRAEVAASREPGSYNYTFERAIARDSRVARFVHVFDVQEKGTKNIPAVSSIKAEKDLLQLTVSTRNRSFHFFLPPPDKGAGTIAIASSDHKTILENRPLAAGILPHGPEGTRLLDLWDSDYRGRRPPLWDIGRPANELVKAVEDGKIQRCRVIDLCCGSGTDAVYLARQGFDVTGLDIAPTALSQAQRKATAAGVSVQWLYADVLNPPSLQPFDFIYDRGCYHVVRDQNLPAYLETVRRLSHSGTKFLLLASRSSLQEANAATAGVTEEEIRYDFLNLFDVEWLREIRLESNKEGGGADPPGWSVLLTRKSD